MAKKKRANREGSVRKRRLGLWEARYTDLQGKRRSLYAKTQSEASAKLRKALVERDGGVAFDAENITFGQFLQRWLADSVKGSVRERTFDNYSYLARYHLAPALGEVQLRHLTAAHLQSLYRQKLDEGLGSGTVRAIHAVAHRALKQALRWRLIPANPAEGVDPPRYRPPEMRPLSREEVTRLFAAAEHERMGSLAAVAVLTGLRAGELLGLRWEDVDLDAGQIKVSRQLIRTTTGVKFGLPKRGSSRRSVELPGRAVSALKRRRAEQAEERLKAGRYWRETNLVFTDEHGEPIYPSNLPRRYLRPLLAKAGIDPEGVRFHDLRHTFATLMFLSGEHPKVVQEAMGHATISQTLDTYSHVIPSMQRDAARRLNELF